MPPIRFSYGNASPEERADLQTELAALDGAKILETGEGGGAPLAGAVIIVIIETGAPIVYDAIKTFGKWLLSRKSRKNKTPEGPVRVTIEGLKGKCTITINSESETPQVDLAELGTVTDIREA
jgi:hypothetical protein